MDAIDNLIYTTLNPCLYPQGYVSNPIQSRFLDIDLAESQNDNYLPPIPGGGTLPNRYDDHTGITTYGEDTRYKFVIIEDTDVIEDAIKKHWFDIANRISYTTNMGEADITGNQFPMYVYDPINQVPGTQAFIKFNTPPYHLIYSYLVENTRIVQIFEKLIWMYLHDEKLTKANNRGAFTWIMNTESLFYKDSGLSGQKNIISRLRPVSEATRRNAYYRMFGMDLAFGDTNNNPYQYEKALFANSNFISLFEAYLVEFWQGYINANNTSGQNTTDTEHLEDLGRDIQEMLMSRRSTLLNFANYRYFNLSAEEYASYIFTFWLFFIISYDSPLVTYLNCNANTPGERLINIGKKVGIPAHTKSEAILDIAQPMNCILRTFELGLFNDAFFIGRVLRSLATANPINPPATLQERYILNNFLLIINNWEKTTSHRIKLPQANVTGTVRIESRPLKPSLP